MSSIESNNDTPPIPQVEDTLLPSSTSNATSTDALFDELKSRIVALNLSKNNYATKKLKNDVDETDEKDLISTLIYVIAELRRCASDIGISDDGKINREVDNIDTFNALNQSVKNLKTQILFLTRASVDELKAEMSKQSDQQYTAMKELATKEKQEKVEGKNETSRRDETRDRLRKHLDELKEKKASTD